MSQGVRAVNKLRTGKLHATRLFRSDKWMKYEQSALVADPGWKTWWELDERETGKPVPVPGPFRHLTEARRVSVSRSDQDHWITPNWMKSHGLLGYTWAIHGLYMGYTIPHPSFCAVNENVGK